MASSVKKLAKILMLVPLLALTESTTTNETSVTIRTNNNRLMEEFSLLLGSIIGDEWERNPEEKNMNNPGVQPHFTRTPSVSPSSSTSSVPTLLPTTKPPVRSIKVPTNVPTESPSISPSDAPTKLICGSDGTFGDQGDNTDAVSVAYSYQVETNPTIDGNMTNDILPAIEKAIHGKLLPVLFETCQENRRLARKQSNVRKRRRLEAVGLSSKPRDVPGTKECQVALTDESNDCTPADGALTLYFRGIQSDDRTLTLNTIKAGMDDGSFENAHPAIVKITFIEDRADPIQDVGDNPISGDTDEGESDISVYYFVLLGVGLGLVIAVGEGTRRYLKKSGDSRDLEDEKLESDSDDGSQEIGSSSSLDSLSNAYSEDESQEDSLDSFDSISDISDISVSFSISYDSCNVHAILVTNDQVNGTFR